MLYRDICKILGIFLYCFSLALIVPLGIAFYYEYIEVAGIHPQPHATWAFFWTLVACLVFATITFMIGKDSSANLFRREGLFVVVLIWFVTPVFGALPFWLSGTLDNPVQAYFEAASGLTTTGATVMCPKKYAPGGEEIPIIKTFCGVHETTYSFYGNIEPVRNSVNGQITHTGIEAVAKALLFWRSCLQWLGGMGIILLFAAILPALGVGGKVLFQAELTGPLKSSLTPRLKESAAHLWKIYLGLTVLEIFFLMVTNDAMPFFDAITVSFSTLSTGGFSIHNESIGYYRSYWTDWVVMVFMIMGSINFSLYFFALHGKFFRIYEPEFLLYLGVLFVACVIGVPLLLGTPEELMSGYSGVFNLADSLRYGIFQIVAAGTSTGFAVANYNAWPYAVQALLLILSYMGGMSGSTAGGIKMVRHFMLFRIAQYKVESLFRPETVRNFRIGDKEVDNSSSILVLCFFLTVISISVISTFIYIVTDIDPQTSIGLVACMLNNTGVAFQMAGPTETFGFLSNFQMLFSVFLMILGRLEYFAILAILVPAFWKQQ